MKKKDYISGATFLILALVLFFQSRNLAVWGEMGPSEGFFPLTLSFVLGLLSLMIIVSAYLKGEKRKETMHILGPKKRKFILYGISFIMFGVVFQKLGYSLTLGVFLVFILKIVEKQSWKMTFMLMAISLVASYYLFVRAFSIPLPEGVLSPLAQLLR